MIKPIIDSFHFYLTSTFLSVHINREVLRPKSSHIYSLFSFGKKISHKGTYPDNINNLLNKKHRHLLIQPLIFYMVTATDTICQFVHHYKTWQRQSLKSQWVSLVGIVLCVLSSAEKTLRDIFQYLGGKLHILLQHYCLCKLLILYGN